MLAIKGGAIQDDQAVLTEMSKQGQQCAERVQVISAGYLAAFQTDDRRTSHDSVRPLPVPWSPRVELPGVDQQIETAVACLGPDCLLVYPRSYPRAPVALQKGPNNAFWNVCRRADSGTVMTRLL